MKSFVHRFIVLGLAALALAPGLLQTPLPAQAAATVYVDDLPGNNGSVSCPGTPNDTLQKGVDAVTTPGKTIVVCPGVYVDPVGISGKTNLKLMAKGIVRLAPVASFTGGFITVLNSTNVTVQGFIIDGGPSLGGSPADAIHYQNASGKITKNTIVSWRQSDPGGATTAENAIHVVNALPGRKVTVDHNTIYDFQSKGIILEGGGASGSSITHNMLVATSGGTFAVYGITLLNLTGGKVIGNTIHSNRDLYNATSIMFGIYLAESSSVKVAGNTVNETYDGIHIETQCVAHDASNNVLSGNKLTDNIFGVALVANYAACANDLDNTKVIANKINQHRLGAGAAVQFQTINSGVINAPVVKGNTFSGYGDNNPIQSGAGVTNPVLNPNKKNFTVPPGT